MDNIPVADNDPDWEDEGRIGETYGDRAPLHISTRHVTARQHDLLEPMIPQYVTLDGAERLAFVQKVSEHLLSPNLHPKYHNRLSKPSGMVMRLTG